MSQQTMMQQARRAAREMAGKRRREHEERERRVVHLAERIMIAIGERDAAVAQTEKRAGEALHELTELEGLSLSEAVRWCGGTVTVREATRLRRLASLTTIDGAEQDGGGVADALATSGLVGPCDGSAAG